MKNFIKLEQCFYSYQRIVYQFTSNLDVFKTHTLFIEYSHPLPERIESIISIPFLALMAPLGWLTGADILIPEVDESYVASLQAIEQIYREWHPHWSFGGEIKTKLQKNTFNPSRYGLLFSLGADSLASFIQRAGDHPILFTVLGLEAPLNTRKSYWKKFEQRVEDFKKEHGVESIFIKTNISRLIDNRKIIQQPNWKLKGSEWWGPVAHGLCLTALTAPISYSYLKHLYIASTDAEIHPEIWGSSRRTDNLLRWGGSQVHHDNDKFDRVEKIKYQICPRPRIYPYLKVCLVQYQSLNCTNCEKCLITIISLLASNIDPAECGFAITPQTLKYFRRRLLYDMFFVSCELQYRSLIILRNDLDLTTLKDMYGSVKFFQWFKNISFKEKNNIFCRVVNHLSRLCFKHNKNKFVRRVHQFFQRGYRFYAHKILLKM